MKKLIIPTLLTLVAVLAVACKPDKTAPARGSGSTRSARIDPAIPGRAADAAPAVRIVPEAFAVKLALGETLPNFGRPPSIYPGSIVTDDVIDNYPGLVAWGGEHISNNRGVQLCKLDFLFRGGKLTPDAKGTIALHVVGNGTRMEVVDVLADPSIWPVGFDDEIKKCIADAYIRRGAPSDLTADFLVDFPLCLDLPDDIDSPEAPTTPSPEAPLPPRPPSATNPQ